VLGLGRDRDPRWRPGQGPRRRSPRHPPIASHAGSLPGRQPSAPDASATAGASAQQAVPLAGTAYLPVAASGRCW